MPSVNKAILIGHLGKDPEIRYMPNGDQVAQMSIATTETWKDKNGEKQERTEWHRIVMYRKLAEIAGQYLKKGRSVYIEGRIQTQKYTDKKDGIERYVTQIIAETMKMLGNNPNSQNQQNQSQAGAGNNNDADGFSDMDDDIPF